MTACTMVQLRVWRYRFDGTGMKVQVQWCRNDGVGTVKTVYVQWTMVHV